MQQRKKLYHILKWSSYVLLIIIAYVLQTTTSLFVIFGVKPLLLAPLAVCIAMFEGEFAGAIFGAVAGLLADAALLVTLTALGPADRAVVWAAALFFVILAFCVGTLVLLGVLHSKYDLEEYARAAGPDKGRDWGSAIMLAATALFLLAGFLLDLWHIAWVVFPIGGILCAIVDTLRKK